MGRVGGVVDVHINGYHRLGEQRRCMGYGQRGLIEETGPAERF